MDRSIYEFLDYREYLRAYYQFKKLSHPGFSLRVFSDRIGFRTKDFISRVMKGEKNLSPASIPKIAQGLGLSSRESAFFEALVLFNQAQTQEERDRYFARMQRILKTVRFAQKQKILAHYQYRVYSGWYHLAIRSLIGLHGFDGDYEALARRLIPPISPSEARESVTLLEECGLIHRDAAGQYHLTQNAITTGDTTSRRALMGFHQHCLRLGAEAVDSLKPDERNISGLTLGISQQSYHKIVERINEFRKEIALIAEEDPCADRVYQLEFLLFPLTR